MKQTASHKAIILFAHGSRDPLWHRPMEAVAAQIAAKDPHTAVACAYLELSTPDLPTVVADMAAAGCTQFSITPMFLGVGRHAREDLPQLVQSLASQHPNLRFKLMPAVGEHPKLVALLADIALEGG
jgi:sirohydrochlorin cobaltochelatase